MTKKSSKLTPISRNPDTGKAGSEALILADGSALDVEEIKNTIARNATDQELTMFLNICKAHSLNPFKREIHFVKYGGKAASHIVGYEVYLKRAERTGQLDGWSVRVAEDNQSATIIINRKDWSSPLEWTVDRKEFDTGQSTWRAMPGFMLKKVAMAQGFRLAFPDELGGMPYTREEMITIDPDSESTLPVPAVVIEDEEPEPAVGGALPEPEQTSEESTVSGVEPEATSEPEPSEAEPSAGDMASEREAEGAEGGIPATKSEGEKDQVEPKPSADEVLSAKVISDIEKAFGTLNISMEDIEHHLDMSQGAFNEGTRKYLLDAYEALTAGKMTVVEFKNPAE